MSARWMTFLIWALVSASALVWGLRLFVLAPPVPVRAAVAGPGPVARADLARLLGADPVPIAAVDSEPPPDARFQLIGVVTPRSPAAAGEGLALIAVDGKQARAYRVGAVVDGQTVLKSVAARGAQLGPREGAPQVTLNLAPVAAAAVGTLPGVSPEGPVAPTAAPGNALNFQQSVNNARARNAQPAQAPRRMLPPPMPPADDQAAPPNGPNGPVLR